MYNVFFLPGMLFTIEKEKNINHCKQDFPGNTKRITSDFVYKYLEGYFVDFLHACIIIYNFLLAQSWYWLNIKGYNNVTFVSQCNTIV